MKQEREVTEMLKRAKAWQERCVEFGDKTAELYTAGQIHMLLWVLGVLEVEAMEFSPLLPINNYREEK